jgi:hypothetical protein
MGILSNKFGSNMLIQHLYLLSVLIGRSISSTLQQHLLSRRDFLSCLYEFISERSDYDALTVHWKM